jgi:protein SCO1/2
MPARFLLGALAALALAVSVQGTARAHDAAHPGDPEFDEAAALGYSQAALGRALGDYRLLDRTGRPVTLGELRGRPLVISLIYTSCVHTCPLVTQTLARAVEVAREALGAESFRVASIGFDAPNDTPERMGIYAREQGVRTSDWLFLSADGATIADLTRELGFVFFRSPKGFDHITQTTVLDREGRIAGHIYGPSFEPPALVEPLKDLALERPLEAHSLAGLIERVRLFCTIYDPAQDRYRLDYSIFVAFAVGALSLGAVAVFLVRAWRQSRVQGPAL